MSRWYEYDDDLFAEDLYSDEDFAFEKMTGERLAWKDSKPVGHGSSGNRPSSSRKDKLNNPSGSCSFPHQVGGVGSGDGTCYQKHQQHGQANAGKNGSPERAKYMKEYRKKYYDTKAQKPKNGMGSRSTVPRPFGQTHQRGGGDKKASLRNQLCLERLKLLKLAYDYPQVRSEVRGLIEKTARAHRVKPNRKLKNPRKQNCRSFKRWNQWSNQAHQDYIKELIENKGKVDGECYNIHSDYGQWGGKSTGKDKAYQKWYNENVRNYDSDGNDLGPSKGKKDRSKSNREKMWRKIPYSKKILTEQMKVYIQENKDSIPADVLKYWGVDDKKKTQDDLSGGGRRRRRRDTETQTQSKPQPQKKDTQTQTQKKETQTQKKETQTDSKPQSSGRLRGRSRKIDL